MGKKLQAGKTKIGTYKGKYSGRDVELSIFFGNYVYPPVNGEFISLRPEEYSKTLKDFLSSDAGQEFDVPTQEEVDQANIVVSKKMNEHKAKVAAEKKRMAEEAARIEEERKEKEKAEAAREVEEEKPVKKELPKVKNPEPKYVYEEDLDEDEEEEAPRRRGKKEKVKISKKDMDELTQMYKKQSNILTIAVIFLVVVVALQMLLNLYLLTR